MKKLLIHVGILFLTFFLFGCIDQNDYVNKSNEEIKNGLYAENYEALYLKISASKKRE